MFTLASLACGISNSQGLLVCARAVQGVAGAIVSAVSLSLIMNLFTEPGERAKAMGVYGFVCAGGGSIGVLLGGLLTNLLSWHWIFLVNLPIGIAVYALCVALLPSARGHAHGERLDVAGAVSVTVSLMLAVYAVVNGNEAGWTSAQTLGLLFAALALLVVFLVIEARVQHPLMPLGLFRLRNVATANVVGVLWAAAMFGVVLHLGAVSAARARYLLLQVGLAFLPASSHHGLRRPVRARGGCASASSARGGSAGSAACGLALFARAPVDGSFVPDVLPGMILLGFGAGIAFNPLLLAAMSGDVYPADSGLASGIVNTSSTRRCARSCGAGEPRRRAQRRAAGIGRRNGRVEQPGDPALLFGAIFAAAAGVLGGLAIAAGTSERRGRSRRTGSAEHPRRRQRGGDGKTTKPSATGFTPRAARRGSLQNRKRDQTQRVAVGYAGFMLT